VDLEKPAAAALQIPALVLEAGADVVGNPMVDRARGDERQAAQTNGFSRDRPGGGDARDADPRIGEGLAADDRERDATGVPGRLGLAAGAAIAAFRERDARRVQARDNAVALRARRVQRAAEERQRPGQPRARKRGDAGERQREERPEATRSHEWSPIGIAPAN